MCVFVARDDSSIGPNLLFPRQRSLRSVKSSCKQYTIALCLQKAPFSWGSRPCMDMAGRGGGGIARAQEEK